MHTKNISLQAAENLITLYSQRGGEVVTVREGCLGLGTVVLFDYRGVGLRAFVIEEIYLNSWSCGHVLKIYENGKLPAKYLNAALPWWDRE